MMMQPSHVLIIDRDLPAALVTQRGLQRAVGASVDVDATPASAASWLRPGHAPLDLLILDPAPDSRAAAGLIKALRKLRPGLPVLVLTAYDTPRLRREMNELGVRDYLAKPVDLPELERRVRSMLGLAPRSPPIRE